MQNADESDHEESIHEDREVGSYRCLINLYIYMYHLQSIPPMASQMNTQEAQVHNETQNI